MTSWKWAVLAIFLSAGPLTVLSHGVLGLGAIATGLLMVLSLGLLLVPNVAVEIDVADLTFAVLLGTIIVSTLINGITADPREYALLSLSLLAFPAGRFFADREPDRGFLCVIGAIAIVGTTVTVPALIDHYNHPHSKPLVFGEYDAAPGQFMGCVCLMLFASLGATNLSRRERLSSLLVVLACSVVFAISQVRSAFLALGATMLVMAVLQPRLRRYALALLGALAVVIVLGLALRPSLSLIYIHQLTMPGVCGEIYNSIGMRRQIFADVFALFPPAPFGIGLDAFKNHTCIAGAHPHNSILQATIEFGWIGGGALVVMTAMAGWRLLRRSLDATFVVCLFVFELVLSQFHGWLSRDGVMFFTLGYALRSAQQGHVASFQAAARASG
ncbi:O-antigen ligase family protein [Bradyrhizobium manausense]|uniref:O-antigen ligase family protein n=1 Tax=Bradyrhizobium manausense TaxID=989370 RepID=UPI001BAA4B76|nr:O-antigen ligase family protein [Bradyrhizobium manausense]MBR0787773.1 O-antigen ligase family protein [Bradyrhizobium manausense]